MKNLLVLLAICFYSISSGQNAEKIRQIDSLLKYYESKNQFMGSVALAADGKSIFNKAYGFSDISKQKKADFDTKYKIGSITKTFTATAVFQLIEEGKLSLDTKLNKYFSEIPNADIITIGNLLGHRSGIYNYTNDTTFMKIVRIPHTQKMMVDVIKKYPSVFVPGTRSEYSNSNYMLLGFIIEAVTGKSYEENITDRIIKKAALINTSYGGKINSSKNEANSYKWEAGQWMPELPWDMSLAGAAGAIISTPSDLNKFMAALFEGKLVSQTSLDQMKNQTEGYGLGLFAIPFNNKQAFGHTGGIEEFASTVGYFPADKVSFAITGNAMGTNNNDIAIAILSIYYNLHFTYPNLDKVKVEDTVLEKYVGIYSAAGFPMKVTIKKDNGELTGQATGQPSFPLTALSPTEFSFKPAGLKLVFSNGQMILKQGGAEYNLSKE